MAVLTMSSPWKHPKTGVLWFRRKVPVHLRASAGRMEAKWTLGTKDHAEARRQWPDALQRWEAMVADWERKAKAEALTRERAREIAAIWGAWVAAGGPLERAGVRFPRAGEDHDAIKGRIAFHSQEALRLANTSATDGTMPVLLEAMAGLVYSAYSDADAQDRARADNLPPVMNTFGLARAMYPVVEPVRPAIAGPTVTFEAIWQAWKAVVENKIAGRTVHETLGMLKQLETFLGHNDAAKVTRDDARKWRDALRADGLRNITINNRLSLIGQVFKRAVADERLPSDPTDGLRLPKDHGAKRLPFSDEDAVKILQAARKEIQPSLRWSHWVMALSGMRVGEVLQLTGDDVTRDPKSGIWFMAVCHAPDEGKSAKNALPRHVPIHPALEAEGFLAFAQGVKEAQGNAPLFSDKKADKYGRLGGRAWNLVGTWVRDTVGITDARKAPNHSWRHRMEDELRAVEVDESIRDAIIGHARKTTGSGYGVTGEALTRLHRELAKVTLPAGLCR